MAPQLGNSLGKTLVYSYVRFSTGEQKQGTGKVRQDALSEAWCKQHGDTHALVRNYADLGVSAYKGRNATHGELSRFLECVRRGQVRPGSVLLVESLDRLSRQNINNALETFLSIINSGVTVVTLCDNHEYSAARCDMTQLMMSLLIFARANDESRMKSQRKAASWRHKREAAVKEGKVLGGKTPAWIAVRDGKYVVVEKEAQKVRAIFNDYVNGHGLYLLHKKHGIPAATIAWWLSNPVVLGTVRITEEGRQVELPNHYPAIIDARTWRLAQRRKAERYVHRRHGPTGFVNLFAGLIFDHLGERMAVQRNYGFPTYVSATPVIVQASWLERVICIDLLRDKFVTVRYEPVEGPRPELAKIQKKIADLQKAMVDGELVDALVPVLRELKKRQRELEGREERVTERLDYGLIRSLFREDDREKRLQLREILRETVKRITIDSVHTRSGGWYVLVKGHVDLVEGGTERFSFAYNSRRLGYVTTEKLDDRVIRHLNEFPRRRERNGGQGGGDGEVAEIPERAAAATPA